MKAKISSNAIAASLLALLAFGALVYLNGSPVAADNRERFEFGSEIEHPFGDKAVTGAAFSAQVTVENSQTLANGVHVGRKVSGALYRDSEGRTRQEFPQEGSPEIVLINDSVAGVLYHLHMYDHTVNKVNVKELSVKREVEKRNAKREHQGREHLEREHQEREHQERERMEKTIAIAVKRPGTESEPQRKVESLGVQTYEGVQAEVTRFTITIPAGREGNDQPFDIVSERWYSPELQVLVMGKRSDPRTGDIIYKLTNISRSEPARSLFEAPADFIVAGEKTEFRRKERQ